MESQTIANEAPCRCSPLQFGLARNRPPKFVLTNVFRCQKWEQSTNCRLFYVDFWHLSKVRTRKSHILRFFFFWKVRHLSSFSGPAQMKYTFWGSVSSQSKLWGGQRHGARMKAKAKKKTGQFVEFSTWNTRTIKCAIWWRWWRQWYN